MFLTSCNVDDELTPIKAGLVANIYPFANNSNKSYKP